MQSNSDQSAHARCEAVRDELPRWLAPAETIFFGPELAEDNEPPVLRLRARGAHFFWVAVPLGGAPFWDAHVGVVVDLANLAGTVGIHRSRGSEPALRLFAQLGPVFQAHRLAHYISEAADEEQWVGAPHDLSTPAGLAEACREFVAILTDARGRLA
ncbi:MAG TPA: hypothetical protein VIG37_23710 [Methylomirabilota bacterium]|jgi:hypothetical protein